MRSKQRGFTIVELLIASGVFSVILLLVSSGIIKIGRVYTKGIIAARTQETARSIIDEITRGLQFNGGIVSPPLASPPPIGSSPPVYGFCIDNHRYSYILDKQLAEGTPDPNQSKHVLVVDSDCSTGIAQQISGGLTADSRELMGLHMLLDADPYPAPASCTTLCTVKIRVVYADRDLLVGLPLSYKCDANIDGSHFCSVSELSSTVEKRVQ